MSLPDNPNLGHLRHQARALQRQLQQPLHVAQRTLARQYGFASWARLKHYVELAAEHSWQPLAEPSTGESGPDRFCRYACLTYTHQDGPHRWHQARELLHHSTETIWAAAAAGHADIIRAALDEDPGLAHAGGGPYGWSPLSYLAYSRVVEGDAVEAARALLAAGADPNEGHLWRGQPNPFTVLTGLFGHGEQGIRRQPPHPQGLEIARMVVAAGADPNDSQTLYNRQFDRDDSHLVLLFEFGLGRSRRSVSGDGNGGGGRSGEWGEGGGAGKGGRAKGKEDRPGEDGASGRAATGSEDETNRRDRTDGGRSLGVSGARDGAKERAGTRGSGSAAAGDGPWWSGIADRIGSPGELLRGQLRWAIEHDMAARVRLLVAHRVDVLSAYRDGRTPAELALLGGRAEIIAALPPAEPKSEADRVIAAIFAGRAPGASTDQARAERPDLIVRAAALGRPDVVRALAALGWDVDAQWRDGQTALHAAAANGDRPMIDLLLSLGADPTVRDTRFDATPLEWAIHEGRHDAAARLRAAD